jgi:hypothetical protein
VSAQTSNPIIEIVHSDEEHMRLLAYALDGMHRHGEME